MADSEREHRMDHVVVVMFENRSFDNLLGYLYRPGEVPSFEGVAGRNLTNPIPEYAPDADRGVVPVHPAEDMNMPDPDPGEEHPHINTQLYGTVEPADNRFSHVGDMKSPHNAPMDPTHEPTMEGFVADYINTFRAEMGRLPRYPEYAQIMACHTPEHVPVLSSIAKGFACFDHWFCEVPSQTYTNRSFFHAATASGMLLNSPPGNFPKLNDAETIFNRLEAAGVSWRVYFHPMQCVSATGLIHARQLAPYFPTHFSSIDRFYLDAMRGTLPAYAFIEPCMVPPHSDMHPPGYARLRRNFLIPSPSPLSGGERLLAHIYEAIRTSSTADGSNFKNTLLLITFDEHGGTYDHVPPPRVAPPDASAAAGEMGFKFDRSGVRVPTLAISAWIDPRTVVSREFRSTSVIRTLRGRWSLGAPLTRRDATAADIAPILTRETPRAQEDWPKVQVESRRVRTLLGSLLARGLPLSLLGTHLLGSALAFDALQAGREPAIDVNRVARRKALRYVRRLKAAAFPEAAKRRRGVR